MSTVDAEEAGTAAPFTAQRWLERLYTRSTSDAGNGGLDVWLDAAVMISEMGRHLTYVRLPSCSACRRISVTRFSPQPCYVLLVWRVRGWHPKSDPPDRMNTFFAQYTHHLITQRSSDDGDGEAQMTLPD